MKIISSEYMQISDLAAKLETTPRAIRYYESMGLMTPLSKTTGGVRLYGKDEVRRLQLIMKLKVLGLELQEMQELVGIYEKQKVAAMVIPRLTELLSNHQRQIKKKITALKSLEKDIKEFREKVQECFLCT